MRKESILLNLDIFANYENYPDRLVRYVFRSCLRKVREIGKFSPTETICFLYGHKLRSITFGPKQNIF